MRLHISKNNDSMRIFTLFNIYSLSANIFFSKVLPYSKSSKQLTEDSLEQEGRLYSYAL